MKIQMGWQGSDSHLESEYYWINGGPDTNLPEWIKATASLQRFSHVCLCSWTWVIIADAGVISVERAMSGEQFLMLILPAEVTYIDLTHPLINHYSGFYTVFLFCIIFVNAGKNNKSKYQKDRYGIRMLFVSKLLPSTTVIQEYMLQNPRQTGKLCDPEHEK